MHVLPSPFVVVAGQWLCAEGDQGWMEGREIA